MIKIRTVLAVIIFCWCLPLQASTPINLFTTGSYQQILQEHKEQAFVMVFWSVDCLPCLTELAMLGKFNQQNPQAIIILVSIDGPNAEREFQSLLDKYTLKQVSNWNFATESRQRLLFEIDQSWYGEVPRAYLFDEQHARQTMSGLLERKYLQKWLNTISESGDK